MEQTIPDIKVFGETAKQINEGDRFIAKVYSVEGRKCVKLEKIEN
jgi:hypothetical protein